MLKEIKSQTEQAILELLEQADLKAGKIFIIGCSTSEVIGQQIGTAPNQEAAQAVFSALFPILQQRGVFLAVQCCEHLNRALVIERELAEQQNLTVVSVLPHPKAGGSLAAYAFEQFSDPVLVEEIQADAGIDIGDTLIGMHLRSVAVPVRVSICKIGNAHLVCAKTRPKYIGGPRSFYSDK